MNTRYALTRIARLFIFCFLGASQAGYATEAVHPLEPLSTNELRSAVQVLLSEKKVTTNTFIPIVTLQEPEKDKVLDWKPGAALPREAFVTTYDVTKHETHEAVVDLDAKRVITWRLRPGVEPRQTGAEYDMASALLKTNADWLAALNRRGITNIDLVDHGAIPGAIIPYPGAGEVRLLRAAPFYTLTNRLTWEPIEGLSAVVDLTHRKILEINDREIIPKSGASMDFFDPAVRGHREGLKPISTTQPQGANFKVENHAVSWDRWRFRYSMNAREGLVLHQIGWEESPGKIRTILYRASLSDILVPYSDPSSEWSWRAYFDESDFGFGNYAMRLVRGVTTVTYATLLSEPMPDTEGTGSARTAQDVVDLYERDAGLLWAHADMLSKESVGPRAKELVIGYLSAVGNYDYRFQWSFRQDGTIEFHVYLTGVMQVKGTKSENCTACAEIGDKAGEFRATDEQAHGVLVADHLLAPHHQHLFNLRLDFDIDGTANSVKELNLKTDRRSRKNLNGNAFSLTQTVFEREKQAIRDLNPASHRMWAVFNPNSISKLGHPAAYLIESEMNTVPFLSPDSRARTRAGFTEHQFFATRYKPEEKFAGGDYPVTTAAPNNILTWARDNERIQNKDIVVWHTFGVTHVARPEDFPVMPTVHTSVRLIPKGFFDRNPALELPDAPVEVSAGQLTAR